MWAVILLLQAAPRPGWYDWPWGSVGAIAVVIGVILTLLKLVFKDMFVTPKQLAELNKKWEGYEGRCDTRTTKFEEKLEKNFATLKDLDGIGRRIDEADKKIDGTINLFTSTRDRADEAYEISRDLRKDLENFMTRMDEKLSPEGRLLSDVQEIKAALRSLTQGGGAP